MKNLNLKNIKNSNGFVAIETLIVASLVVASGAFFMSKLAWKGKDISTKSNNSLNMSKNILENNSSNSGNSTSTPGTDTPNTPGVNNEKPNIESNFEYKVIDDDFIQNEIQRQQFSGEPFPASLDEKCANELKAILEKEKGNIVITKYTGIASDIVVPSEIDGKKVVAISQRAMGSGCIAINKLQTTIKSYEELLNKIKNPSLSEDEKKDCLAYFFKHEDELAIKDRDRTVIDWVNSLGELYRDYSMDIHMGNSNEAITNVTLPDTIKVIGNGAFSGDELTNINLKNVEYIGADAFSSNKLTNIIFPSSLKYIGQTAFFGNQLTNVEFPNSIECIGFNAFYNNKLTKVTIPSSCTNVLGFEKSVTLNKI